MSFVVKPTHSLIRQAARRMIGLARQLLDPPPQGKAICDLGGVKLALDFDDQLQLQIFRGGAFEPEVAAILQALVQPADVVMDIGANIGWHSLALLVRQPNVQACYAFEPSAKAFAALEQGIAANHLESRCFARRTCLGSHDGLVTIKHFAGLGTLHSSRYALGDLPFVEEAVPITRLDTVADEISSPIALVKCDVEGGERDVLLGATQLLAGRYGPPPIWLLEVNYETAGMAGYFPWELVEIVQQHAPYQPFVIRKSRLVEVKSRTAMRHGDTLVLAIPSLHDARLQRVYAETSSLK